MDSRISQLKQLLEAGKRFNFDNFCYPHHSSKEYGGQDTPEWLTWKTRTYNIVREIVSHEAPAAKLVASGNAIQTSGNRIDSFNRAKLI